MVVHLHLGAVTSFWSIFGRNVPRFPENLEKLTFEYPHEEPGVGKAAHLVRAASDAQVKVGDILRSVQGYMIDQVGIPYPSTLYPLPSTLNLKP